ncbi:MAG: hypothetical protein H6574_04245 [Lewinellaceae bacterium]|nr:hypothetical protein [Saprospiraceae bacterium]MCB9330272.1 hypothetical protein [Lewinellaceae bacterium]
MKKLAVLAGFILLFLQACEKDSTGVNASGKSGSITRFAIHQGYMYVLNLNEVRTYSLQNPDQPVLVNRLQTNYGLETIIIYDNTIYLGSSTALYILDISNPAAPSILSQTNRDVEFFGGCDPVVVKGSYAYSTVKIIQNVCGFVSAQSALLVYDVSDKSAPVHVGTYSLGLPNGLGYKDNYLFVCDDGTDRLEIFDISDPLALTPLGNYSVDITDPYDLIVEGSKMIISTKTDFQIFDLQNLPEVKRTGLILK